MRIDTKHEILLVKLRECLVITQCGYKVSRLVFGKKNKDCKKNILL